MILVHTLTEATGDDATTALDLLNAVEGPLVRVTADSAYDTVAVYETARARGVRRVSSPWSGDHQLVRTPIRHGRLPGQPFTPVGQRSS